MSGISIILLTYFIVGVLSISANLDLYQGSEIKQKDILGVRWSFGSAFNLDNQITYSQMYELRFNTFSSLNTQVFVKMGDRTFACSQSIFIHEKLTIYTYVCLINQKPSSWTYRICSRDSQSDSYNQSVVFQSRLRMGQKQNESSILMFGDLWIDQAGSLPCQTDKMLNNEQASIIIIGSFFPSFNESNYQSIIRKLQPITSQVITIPAYQIRNQSEELFYHLYFPSQKQEYSTLVLSDINTIFVKINPQGQKSSTIGLTQQLKEKIDRQNYFVVVISHENAYSNDRSKFYEEIGMDLLLSSQVNQEFSNKMICWGKQDSLKPQECPYILHEGSLFNNQMDHGALSINNKHQVSFTHYSMCLPSSHFDLHFSTNETSTNATSDQINYALIQKMFIAIEYIVVIVLCIFTIVTIVSIRKKTKKLQSQGGNHIQLVEQIVNQSQPNDPQT